MTKANKTGKSLRDVDGLSREQGSADSVNVKKIILRTGAETEAKRS